jgi:hypothetical protein
MPVDEWIAFDADLAGQAVIAAPGADAEGSRYAAAVDAEISIETSAAIFDFNRPCCDSPLHYGRRIGRGSADGDPRLQAVRRDW